MQAFDVLWLRWLLVMILGGLALALVLFLAFYLAPGRRSPPDQELEEFAADIRVGRKPTPIILILVYIGTAIFMIGYVLHIWLGRVSY